MRIDGNAGMKPWPQRAEVEKDQAVKEQTESGKGRETAARPGEKADRFERSESKPPVTYGRPKQGVDNEAIRQLQADSEKAYQSLRQLVERLLERQGHSWEQWVGAEDGVGSREIVVDETAQAEAQALLDEGGAMSADAVSDRIVNFAIAFAEKDPSKLPMLRSAIEAGFEAAAKAFGGMLPDISFRTYDLIVEKLDAWEEGQRTPSVEN